ncbi:MAG: RNA helicase [Sanya dicistrovirus 2]|nr:MAG: RNA helicase [Sanya dicistrovirus 2]
MVRFFQVQPTGYVSYVKGLVKEGVLPIGPGLAENAINNILRGYNGVKNSPGGTFNYNREAVGRNGLGKDYVKLHASLIKNELAMLGDKTRRISKSVVRGLRRQTGMVASPSQMLEDLLVTDDGTPILTATHLTTNPKPREIVGHVDGYGHNAAGVAAAVDVEDDRRESWNGGVFGYSDRLGRGEGEETIRTIRIYPASMSETGRPWAEYSAYWKIHKERVYLDIPLFKLTKREFLGVAKRWKKLSDDERAWWCGYDIIVHTIMLWSDRRSVMRYAWNQHVEVWSHVARRADKEGLYVEDVERLLLRGLVGEDQAWIGMDHYHQFPIFDKVSKAFKSLGKHIGDVVGGPWFNVLTSCGLLAAGLYYAQSRSTMFIHLIQFLHSIHFTQEQTDIIQRCVRRTLDARTIKPSVCEPQPGPSGGVAVGEDQMDGPGGIVPLHYLLPIFGTVVIMAIMGTACASKVGSKTWDTLIARFARMGQCVNSIEKASAWGSRFGDILETTVAQYIFGAPAGVYDFTHRANTWCDEIAALATTNYEDRVQTDRTLRATIDRLLMEGNDIGKSMQKFNFPREQSTRFHKSHSLLHALRAKATEGNPSSMKMRPVPLLIHYVGDTGVGKSTMLDCLCTRILVELGFTSETMLEDYVYHYKASKDGFWSGYHDGVKIIICDDMFSLRDSPNNPSAEALDTIGMANTAPFPLTMADLSSKGSTYMNAEVIIWTTNQRDYIFPSLTNEEAIFNRIDMQFVVTPKQGYSKNISIRGKPVVTLDRAKIKDALEKDPGALIQFTDYQQVDPKATGIEPLTEKVDFEVMVANVLDNLRSKEEHFVNVKAARKQFREEALRRKNQAEKKFKSIEEINAEIEQLPTHSRWPYNRDAFDFMCVPAKTTPNNVLREDGNGSDEVDMPGLKKEASKEKLVGEDQMFLRASWIIKTDGWWNRTYHCDVLDYFIKKGLHWSRNVWLGIPVDTPPAKCIKINNIALVHEEIEQYVRCCMIGHGDPEMLRLVESARQKGVEIEICNDCVPATTWKDVEAYIQLPFTTGYLEKVGEEIATDEPLSWNKPAVWGTVAALIAVAAVAIGMLVWWLSSKKDPEVENESYNTSDKGAKQVTVESYNGTDKGAKKVSVEKKGSDEALVDGNAYELSAVAQKNIYMLQKKDGDGEWNTLLQVFFIFGRVAITNRHLIRAMKENDGEREWRIISAHSKSAVYKFTQKQINLAFPKDEGENLKDLMLIEFPPCVPQHRDMRSHIIDRADMSKFSSLGRVTLTTHVARSKEPIFMLRTTDRLTACDTWYCATVADKTYRRIRSYYQYGCDTEKGECGGVLIVNDPSFTKKIIGIHSGGVKGDAMPAIAQPISREIINEYLTHFEPRNAESMISAKVEGVDQADMPEEFVGHDYHGVDHHPVYANGKSNIHESVIADCLWPAKTKPAHLSKFTHEGMVIDPMKKARDKVLVAENPILDGEVLDVVTGDVCQLVATPELGVEPKVETWEVAIEGKPGDDLFPPMNRKTSPGYGWNKAGGGKAQYFGRDQNYIFDHPAVIARREEYLEALRRGERLCVKWEDALKDERRPLAKVDAGKTRMFSVGCQVFTVLFRQYFMAFQAQVMKGRIDNEIAVGVNVYSFDWHALACKLQSKGVDVLAGDFTNYDGTLCAEIMWRVLDVVESFYARGERTELDVNIRRLLWSDIVYSIHVSGRHCYSWSHSNPSGCPITTILNSVYHCIAARYVFVKAAQDAGLYGTMKLFREKVYFVCYGDDDVWNIADDIQGWFNMETITEQFGKIGMVYTDETKTEGAVCFRRLEDVKFLKRAFAKDISTGRYRAPLDLDVIREMPRWIRGRKNEWELAAETLEEAAEELALHPEEVFKENITNFRRAQARLASRVSCRLDTYQGYQWRLSERARK